MKMDIKKTLVFQWMMNHNGTTSPDNRLKVSSWNGVSKHSIILFFFSLRLKMAISSFIKMRQKKKKNWFHIYTRHLSFSLNDNELHQNVLNWLSNKIENIYFQEKKQTIHETNSAKKVHTPNVWWLSEKLFVRFKAKKFLFIHLAP